jgi:hypothetical protein
MLDDGEVPEPNINADTARIWWQCWWQYTGVVGGIRGHTEQGKAAKS